MIDDSFTNMGEKTPLLMAPPVCNDDDLHKLKKVIGVGRSFFDKIEQLIDECENP